MCEDYKARVARACGAPMNNMPNPVNERMDGERMDGKQVEDKFVNMARQDRLTLPCCY